MPVDPVGNHHRTRLFQLVNRVNTVTGPRGADVADVAAALSADEWRELQREIADFLPDLERASPRSERSIYRGNFKPTKERTDGRGNEILDDWLYYVQDCRSLVGNCISWWAKDGHGYCCNLHDAHVFRGADVRDMRGTDVPWPFQYVTENVLVHVRGDTEAFRRTNYKPGPR